jgi:hypothetical protein
LHHTLVTAASNNLCHHPTHEEVAVLKRFNAAVVLVSLVAFPLSVSAQGHGHGPPDKEGGPPGKGQGQGQGQGASQGISRSNVVIADRDRGIVRDYYRNEYVRGNCPPGLAKKNNGCLPPGQANKVWATGQPLPPGVVYYPLPGALLGQLTPLPAGYQYVQVANDILLMAVGTRMIVGALADLSSL